MNYLYNSCAIQEQTSDKEILPAHPVRICQGKMNQTYLDYVIFADQDIFQDSNFKLLCFELENRLIINLSPYL